MSDAPVRLGAFVKQDTSGAALPGNPVGSNYRGINIMSTKKDDYVRGADSQFKDAVVIPRSSDTGGPKGDINIYGTITMGSVHHNDKPVADFAPKMLLEADKVPEPVPPPKMNKKGAFKQKQLTDQLAELDSPDLEEVPEDDPSYPKDPSQTPEAFNKMLEQVKRLMEEKNEVEQSPKISVALKGPFGVFKGKFMDIVETDNLLVLVYDPLESVFCPPSGMQKLSMSWLTNNKEVYYSGIDFVLEKFGVGLQVYVPAEGIPEQV